MAGEGDASAGAGGLEAEYGQFFLSNLRLPCHLAKLEGVPSEDTPAKPASAVPAAPVASLVRAAAPLATPAPLEPEVPIAPVACKGTAAGTAALPAQRALPATAEVLEAQPEEAGLRLGPTPRQGPPEPAATAALPRAALSLPLPSRSKPEMGASAARRPESVLGEPRSHPTAPDATQRTPSQSSRPFTGQSMPFMVHVPKRYPGVQFRASMNLDDRSDKHAGDGEIVTGTLSPNGQWLRADEHGLYLPVRVGENRILESVRVGAHGFYLPVPVGPAPVEAGGAQEALAPGLEEQFVVRVPRSYPGIQFRRSKDLSDRHGLSAARDERICGRVEDEGLWLRVHRGGEALFLPISLGGSSVLVPARDDVRAGVGERAPQALHHEALHHQDDDDVAPQGSSPGSFAACGCFSPQAVDAEMVREDD